MIPPEHTAEFVAGMEDVPEVYRRPYDPRRPVICLDEQPTQLLGETRTPIPLQPGQAQRHEDDYARIGTADTFMIAEPLTGRHTVSVRATKTARDLGHEIKELLDVDDPKADKVVPVWDTLNTYAPASLYDAFPPRKARRLLDRLEIHDTPNTAGGSTAPRSPSASSPSRVWIGASTTSTSCAARPRPGRIAAMRPGPLSTGSSRPTMHASHSNASTQCHHSPSSFRTEPPQGPPHEH